MNFGIDVQSERDVMFYKDNISYIMFLMKSLSSLLGFYHNMGRVVLEESPYTRRCSSPPDPPLKIPIRC